MMNDQDGNFTSIDGKITKFRVSGNDIGLVTDQISLEGNHGVVNTKKYGRFELTLNGGAFAIWMTPSQKAQLRNLAVQSDPSDTTMKKERTVVRQPRRRGIQTQNSLNLDST